MPEEIVVNMIEIVSISTSSPILSATWKSGNPSTDIIKSKPYTAITVQINRLTGEQYESEDLSGIPDLIEVIRIQNGGPTEAARAIRKKL